MTKEIGTLEELNVKPGDVVEYDGGFGGKIVKRTVAGWKGSRCYHTDHEFGGSVFMMRGPGWRIISRASGTPKTWGEMTDEEKGVLLLAHHEGKVIEFLNGPYGWSLASSPRWRSEQSYRIRPEHKRETVAIDTHRITFDLIDGEPDCSSVKMEKL